jgi:predicted secreted protein
MLWLLIIWLACLAVVLEIAARALSIADDGVQPGSESTHPLAARAYRVAGVGYDLGGLKQSAKLAQAEC